MSYWSNPNYGGYVANGSGRNERPDHVYDASSRRRPGAAEEAFGPPRMSGALGSNQHNTYGQPGNSGGLYRDDGTKWGGEWWDCRQWRQPPRP